MLTPLLVAGCSNDDSGFTPNGNDCRCSCDGDWLIPKSNVFDGGPGCDGIPALTNPPFVALAEVTYLNDNSLSAPTAMIGYWFGWGTFYPGLTVYP